MGSKKVKSKVLGAVVGAGLSWTVCAIGVLILSQLVITQKLGEGGSDTAIAAILVISTLAGVLTASGMVGKNRVVVGLASSGIWLLSVVIVSMLMEGSIQNAALSLTSIAIGGLIGCALCLKKSGKTKGLKRRNR